MKQLMTGDEAIARGAWEAGVRFAAAYPGTPSTEILENLSRYDEIHTEWASNEKTALESAIGASVAGVRSMASMKHVGMNVAADPLFTWAYMGVSGGNVIVTADEPGMYSSQNEQDNRNYARAARIPMLEPADSGECLAMMKDAFAFSEEYNTPVIVRMTTRVCHSKSVVETGERTEVPVKEWVKNPARYVSVPANAKRMRVELEERVARLAAYSEESCWNTVEDNGSSVGVIASGICYKHAKEVFGDTVSYLKIGFSWPLPMKLIASFCEGKETIYVIEENDPLLEEAVKIAGYTPKGKDTFPAYDEITPAVIRASIGLEPAPTPELDASDLIARVPTFCAGCPHRGFFYALGKRKDIMISGDIGCYTLASGAPYKALDSALCMGASISLGHGAQQAFNMTGTKKKAVCVLGDSTFFHTGVNSLINTVYNGSNTINVILDNRITGMTGHQDNPGTGYNAKGEPAALIDLETLVKAIGVKHVRVVDPNNLAEVNQALDDFMDLTEPSVIITRWPCALKKFSREDRDEFSPLFTEKYVVDKDVCIGCKLCTKGGCPALSFNKAEKKAVIDRSACVGCGVCAQICPKNAIGKEAAK